MATVKASDVLAAWRQAVKTKKVVAEFIEISDSDSDEDEHVSRVSRPALSRVATPFRTTKTQYSTLSTSKIQNANKPSTSPPIITNLVPTPVENTPDDDTKPQSPGTNDRVRASKRSAGEAFGSPAQDDLRVRSSTSHSPAVNSQIRPTSSSSLSTAISITTSEVRDQTPKPAVRSQIASPASNDSERSQARTSSPNELGLSVLPVTPDAKALQGLLGARALAQASISPRTRGLPKARDKDVQTLVNEINLRPLDREALSRLPISTSLGAVRPLVERSLLYGHANPRPKQVTFLDGSLHLTPTIRAPNIVAEPPAAPIGTQTVAAEVRSPVKIDATSEDPPSLPVLAVLSEVRTPAGPPAQTAAVLNTAPSHPHTLSHGIASTSAVPLTRAGPIFHGSSLPDMKGRPFTIAEKVCVIYLKTVLKLSWADIDTKMGRGHNCTATIYVRNVVGLKEPAVQAKLGYRVGKSALDKAFQHDITIQQALIVAEAAMTGRPVTVPSLSQFRAQIPVPRPKVSVPTNSSIVANSGRTLIRHSRVGQAKPAPTPTRTLTAIQEAVPPRRRGRPRKDAIQVRSVVPDIVDTPQGDQSRPRRSAAQVDYRIGLRLSVTPEIEAVPVSSAIFDKDQVRRAPRPIVRTPLSQVLLDRSIKSKSGSMVNDYMGSYRKTLRWSGASSDINTIAWAADGDYFAAGAIVDDIAQKHPTNFLRGRVSDGHLTHQAQSLGMPRASRSLSDVVFLTNSNHLITGGYDGVVRLYANQGYGADIRCDPISIYDVQSQVNLVATNTCDAVIAIGCRRDEDSILLTQITEDLEIAGDCGLSFQSDKALQHPLRQVFPTSLRWGPPNKSYYLAGGFAAHDGDVRHFGELCIWDCEHQAQPLKYRTGGMIMDIKWTADGNYLAFAREVQNAARKGSRSQIDIMAMNTFRTHGLNLECPADDIVEVVLCPYDANIVAASTTDGNAYIWDVRNANTILHTLSHGEPDVDYQEYIRKEPVGVGFLAWADEYASLYSGGHDGVVTSWDIRRAPGDVCTRNTRVSPAGIYCGQFNSDCSSLLLGEIGGSIAVLERSVEHFGRTSTEYFCADKLPDIGVEPEKMENAPEEGIEISPDPIEFLLVGEKGEQASYQQAKMGGRHRKTAFFRVEVSDGVFPPVVVDDDWETRIPDAIADNGNESLEAFACLKCGGPATMSVISRITACSQCRLAWQGGVLGYGRAGNVMSKHIDRPVRASAAPEPDVDGELAHYTSLWELTQ